MTIDERIQHLLRAALRAEREGNARAARALRRMVEDFSEPRGDTTSG